MFSHGKQENVLSRSVARMAWEFRSSFAATSFVVALLAAVTIVAPASRADGDITLREGWAVQSSAKVNAGGEAVSAAGFDASGWYKTSAPNTVFAVLVENGAYKDPFFGLNLRSVPGVSYAIGSEFANQEMPENSPYAVHWWYRKEFDVPAQFSNRVNRDLSKLLRWARISWLLQLTRKRKDASSHASPCWWRFANSSTKG
jgi:hypothetical protein